MSRVIVVGGIIMDLYIMLDRLPKVSETLIANGFREVPGGKGLNTAVGASRLGADTMLLGKIGNDSFGRKIGEFLSRQRISLMIYRDNNENTGMAVIQRSPNSETTIAVVYGSNLALKYSEARRIAFKKGDVLIAQLEIPQGITKRLLKKGRDAGAVCILGLTPITRYDKSLKDLADVIIINESELRHFSGGAGKISNMMKAIRTRQDQAVITTLGADGSMILRGSRIVKIKGRKVNVVDATGAGDCFLAALAARMSVGEDIEKAARYANVAASICVQKIGTGTAMPTSEEVEKELKRSRDL